MEVTLECTSTGEQHVVEVGVGDSVGDVKKLALTVFKTTAPTTATLLHSVQGTQQELADTTQLADCHITSGETLCVTFSTAACTWQLGEYETTYSCKTSAVCDGYFVGGDAEGFALINLHTGATQLFEAPGHMEGERSVALTPTAVVFSEGPRVYFINRKTGEQKAITLTTVVMRVAGMPHTEDVIVGCDRALARYSPEGTIVGTYWGGEGLQSFSVSESHRLCLTAHNKTILDALPIRGPLVSPVGIQKPASQFSPDGRLFLCHSQNPAPDLVVADSVEASIVCRVKAAEDIESACFGACSKVVFTCGGATVASWDAATGWRLGCIERKIFGRFIAACPDGAKLLVAHRREILILNMDDEFTYDPPEFISPGSSIIHLGEFREGDDPDEQKAASTDSKSKKQKTRATTSKSTCKCSVA